MAQPIPAQETFGDLIFPARGVDLSQGFGMQLPGTTPTGLNVRVYESLTQRGRGGQRPGISKYVDDQVPNGAQLIQHLNIIVDPTTAATLDEDDTGTDLVDDLSTDGPASSWGITQNSRVPRVRKIRRGGHGRQHGKNRKPSKIKFVQAATKAVTTNTSSVNYTKAVTKGNLLVVVAGSEAPGAVFAISDSLGNTYTQAIDVHGTSAGLSLWYCIANSSGPNSVTFDAPGSARTTCGILEYSGVDKLTPLDGTVSNVDNHTNDGSNWTTGTVPVANNGELVLGCFANGFEDNVGFTAGTGFKLRCNHASALDGESLIVEEILDQQASLEAVGTAVNTPDGFGRYGAVGASFAPQGA